MRLVNIAKPIAITFITIKILINTNNINNTNPFMYNINKPISLYFLSSLNVINQTNIKVEQKAIKERIRKPSIFRSDILTIPFLNKITKKMLFKLSLRRTTVGSRL